MKFGPSSCSAARTPHVQRGPGRITFRAALLLEFYPSFFDVNDKSTAKLTKTSRIDKCGNCCLPLLLPLLFSLFSWMLFMLMLPCAAFWALLLLIRFVLLSFDVFFEFAIATMITCMSIITSTITAIIIVIIIVVGIVIVVIVGIVTIVVIVVMWESYVSSCSRYCRYLSSMYVCMYVCVHPAASLDVVVCSWHWFSRPWAVGSWVLVGVTNCVVLACLFQRPDVSEQWTRTVDFSCHAAITIFRCTCPLA